jgi:hypothetical protein
MGMNLAKSWALIMGLKFDKKSKITTNIDFEKSNFGPTGHAGP